MESGWRYCSYTLGIVFDCLKIYIFKGLTEKNVSNAVEFAQVCFKVINCTTLF
jgi:hypothetical protein